MQVFMDLKKLFYFENVKRKLDLNGKFRCSSRISYLETSMLFLRIPDCQTFSEKTDTTDSQTIVYAFGYKLPDIGYVPMLKKNHRKLICQVMFLRTVHS